ncbi:hypothetical protein MRX96_004910 [Rhipicephalus microplus]
MQARHRSTRNLHPDWSVKCRCARMGAGTVGTGTTGRGDRWEVELAFDRAARILRGNLSMPRLDAEETRASPKASSLGRSSRLRE